MSEQQQACDCCGGPTTFATEIRPLGRDPGHQVFYCEACERHTWTTGHTDGLQQGAIVISHGHFISAGR